MQGDVSKGLFDAEGYVSKEGYVSASNSDYGLLTYVQELLREFVLKRLDHGLKIDQDQLSMILRKEKYTHINEKRT
jgi:hypothetical protein